MIISKQIKCSPTYPSVETDDICITIDNGSSNTVGESCYSAHQTVSRFAEDHSDMVQKIIHKTISIHIIYCSTYPSVETDDMHHY